jgi:hypothetical protein
MQAYEIETEVVNKYNNENNVTFVVCAYEEAGTGRIFSGVLVTPESQSAPLFAGLTPIDIVERSDEEEI